MKRNYFILAMLAILTMSATMGTKMVLVEDSCKKCSITETSYTCGKCQHGMSIKQEWEDDTMKWMKCTFTCKNCSHKCTYKYKP